MRSALPRIACSAAGFSLLVLCGTPSLADPAKSETVQAPLVERRETGGPDATPDIIGIGRVSTAGNAWLKTTNIGVIGNPFTALSGDPSLQWPGPSGVEYLHFVGLWVGAKDLSSADPSRLRRVSQNTEWRPPSLEPADRIYESYEGEPGGKRLVDDDEDGSIDEDRLDGRDNDLDGLVDEDFAAVSQQMFSCVLRDDTQEAIEMVSGEAHIPLGLEVHQTTYAFSVPGATNYTCVEYVIRNAGDTILDSVFVAFQVDQDVGPVSQGRYFIDDLPEPRVPQGPDSSIAFPDHPIVDNPNTPYMDYVSRFDPRSTVCHCTRDAIRVHGFTMIDNDGDKGQTAGATTFLLLDHTLDPIGRRGPQRVQFRSYYYYRPGLPFSDGGAPSNDSERYELISSTRNVDQVSGYITARRPDQPGDYVNVCSVGPYLRFAPGATITVAYALAVQEIDYQVPRDDLPKRYAKLIRTAVAAQKNYRGVYETRVGFPVSDRCGREAAVIGEPGEEFLFGDCWDLDPLNPSGGPRRVSDQGYTWYDSDCNSCTGVSGHRLRHWSAGVAPPNPGIQLAAGDDQVFIEWDNLSEYTPDPQSNTFDFKGYSIWRAAGWERPQGSTGPSNDLWENLANYFLYDEVNPLIERVLDPSTGDTVEVKTANVLLNRAWSEGSPYPRLIHPRDVPCVELSPGICDVVLADKDIIQEDGGDSTITDFPVIKYPIGRYRLTDPQAKNGFSYFYAVVAFDSTGKHDSVMLLEGGRAAREGDVVIPQVSATGTGGGSVFVVPNPYRGDASWDLTPNATDPTGTHIDFFNMPANWTVIKIYTVSGDLVQEIRPTDFQPNGKPQRETPDDGQASWNLISRNGQEVVSGIYMFTVRADGGMQRGKFVVIR